MSTNLWPYNLKCIFQFVSFSYEHLHLIWSKYVKLWTSIICHSSTKPDLLFYIRITLWFLFLFFLSALFFSVRRLPLLLSSHGRRSHPAWVTSELRTSERLSRRKSMPWSCSMLPVSCLLFWCLDDAALCCSRINWMFRMRPQLIIKASVKSKRCP